MQNLEDSAQTLGLSTAAVAAVLSPRFSSAYSRLHHGPLDREDLVYCLDHLLRLFTGLAAGLAHFLDPSRPELGALAASLESPVQFERLLRFSVNLLRQSEPQPAQQQLLAIFFGEAGEPLPLHTSWLQLGATLSDLPPLSKTEQFEAHAQIDDYLVLLQGWLQLAVPFLKSSAWELSRSLKAATPLLRRWIFAGHSIALLPPLPWEMDLRRPEPSMPIYSSGESEWSPLWSATQADTVAHRLSSGSTSLAERVVPAFLRATLLQETAQRASAYFLLEGQGGIGKSLALAGLMQSLGHRLPFLYFPVRSCFRGDFQTLIEEIDEGIQERHDSQTTPLVGLGPLVIQKLNRRYAAAAPAEKFQAYVSQLILRNGQRFVLALDGLDEAFEGADSNVSLADYLPDSLPEGVFLLLSYRLEGCSARLARRLVQLAERGSISLSLRPEDPLTRGWYQQVLEASGVPAEAGAFWIDQGASLLHARVLGQAFDAGALTDVSAAHDELWSELFGKLEQRWGEPFLRFLMVLATSYTPVPLDEIRDLGFDPDMIEQLLGQHSALFLATAPTATSGWRLQLAHENLRLHLQEHYSHRYSQTCQRLAARAAHQLLNRPPWGDAETEALASGSFRLDCLYRWLLDSQNVELTESVLTSRPLQQLRNQVCGYLEQRGRFHQKLSILQGLKSCLELLVSFQESTELRDELAWAYNSRGLTYLHLGQFTQGLRELEFAEQQFRLLVSQKTSYRSGLASALNRRSEALRALGQVGEAWECAHQSVEQHRQALQEAGPQGSPLGLARALVQRARCACDHSLWPRALTDLQESLGLLELSTRQAQARGGSEVSAHLYEWIRALIVRADAYRVNGQPDDCLLDLDQALSLTQHLEEVQVVDWTNTRAPEIQVLQARAYESLQGVDEAFEAYGDAIHGFDQQVRAGRLDLRQALAEAYHARAELQRRRKKEDQALQDYTRSLAFQAQLIECEEQSDLRPFRALTYQGRGDCLYGRGSRREALQDYDKSIEDSLFALNSGRLQQPELLRLANVYLLSGEIQFELGEAGQAADRATSAIQIWEDRLGGGNEELPRAYLLQADSLRQLGDMHTALTSASKAIQVLSLRVRDDSGGLQTHLARGHHLRGQLAQKLGDLNQALKDYGLAFQLFGTASGQQPDRLRQAEILRCRAELQSGRGDMDAAEEDLAAAFDLLSDHPEQSEHERIELHLLRARLWRSQGRLHDALGELLLALEQQRQLPSSSPLRHRVVFEVLSLQAESGLWDEFTVLYSELLLLRDQSPEVDIAPFCLDLFREVAAREGGGEARADVLVALARLCAQLDSAAGARLQTEALYQRGLQRLQIGRVTEALEDFSEAIAQLRSRQLEGSDSRLLADLYSVRADGLLRAGLRDRAHRDLDEASRLVLLPGADDGTRLARLVARKAVLLRLAGEYQQIIQEVGLALGPGSSAPIPVEDLSWLYLTRAMSYDEIGQPGKAVSDYREAAQLLSQLPETIQALQERLRCRIRLLELETSAQGQFLVYCAEDALRCLSRIRALDPELAAPWVLPWTHQLSKRAGNSFTGAFYGHVVDELSHYLPGALSPRQCQQLAQLLCCIGEKLISGGVAVELGDVAQTSERLLGTALNLGLLGPRSEVSGSLLESLRLLQQLYRDFPEKVPSLNLDPAFRQLQEQSLLIPPEGELGVTWNNGIRGWLQLSDHQLAACGLDRQRLQALRLW